MHSWLGTGSMPGMAASISDTWLLGSAPNSVEAPEKSFASPGDLGMDLEADHDLHSPVSPFMRYDAPASPPPPGVRRSPRSSIARPALSTPARRALPMIGAQAGSPYRRARPAPTWPADPRGWPGRRTRRSGTWRADLRSSAEPEGRRRRGRVRIRSHCSKGPFEIALDQAAHLLGLGDNRRRRSPPTARRCRSGCGAALGAEARSPCLRIHSVTVAPLRRAGRIARRRSARGWTSLGRSDDVIGGQRIFGVRQLIFDGLGARVAYPFGPWPTRR